MYKNYLKDMLGTPVAHTYNPTYSGDRSGGSQRPAWANSSQNTYTHTHSWCTGIDTMAVISLSKMGYLVDENRSTRYLFFKFNFDLFFVPTIPCMCYI
jgi:hypothetical protein